MLKAGIGDTDDMVAWMSDVLLKYSSYKSNASSGVSSTRKLFGDLNPLVTTLPKLWLDQDEEKRLDNRYDYASSLYPFIVSLI